MERQFIENVASKLSIFAHIFGFIPSILNHHKIGTRYMGVTLIYLCNLWKVENYSPNMVRSLNVRCIHIELRNEVLREVFPEIQWEESKFFKSYHFWSSLDNQREQVDQLAKRLRIPTLDWSLTGRYHKLGSVVWTSITEILGKTSIDSILWHHS